MIAYHDQLFTPLPLYQIETLLAPMWALLKYTPEFITRIKEPPNFFCFLAIFRVRCATTCSGSGTNEIATNENYCICDVSGSDIHFLFIEWAFSRKNA